MPVPQTLRRNEMASATVNRPAPIEPPAEGITLDLSIEEAQVLFGILSCISVQGIGKTSYKIFNALYDTKELHTDWLTPVLEETGFGTPLITFKEE
jgi:hypothetical protein